MRSPPPPPPSRRRNGHQILPIIYIQPQSKAKRHLIPILVVCTCGFWIFALGTLIERLPHGRELPNIATAPSLSSSPSGTSVLLSTTTRGTSVSGSSSSSSSSSSNKHINNTTGPETTTLPKSSPAKEDTHSYRKTALEIKQNARKGNESQQHKAKDKDKHDNAHVHEIPNVLIFTHAFNLLTYQPLNETITTGDNNTKAIIEEEQELLALKQNIQHTIDLHPNARVRFLTDNDCLQSLQNMLGPEAPLIHYFQRETAGMYKADICRGAALWETGGLYLDVDVGVRMSLWDVLSHDTTFATALVHQQSFHVGSFFQAFMAVTPRHVILERYMQLFQDYYQGNLTRPIKKGPLGVILLRQAFDDVVHMSPPDPEKGNHKKSNGGDYFRIGPKTLETRHGKMEIWQEVQYHPKYFPDLKPVPTWGTRRACHFVVVANRKFPLVVPLYSRIAGSRMCRETHDDHDKKKPADKNKHDHEHFHLNQSATH